MTWSDWLLRNGNSLKIALFFLLFGVFAVLERLVPLRPPPPEQAARVKANGVLTVLNLLVLAAFPVSFVSAAFWADRRGIGLLHKVAVPAALVVVASLMARSFISFFTHFLMHRIPLFWRFHRVHHLDTELDVTTTVRFHPLEFLVGTLPGIPIVVLGGLDPLSLVAYEIVKVAVTLLSHSNFRIPAQIERCLRYLIVTPDLHRLHHSSWQPETDSNFGATFPIWDLIFGTFRTRARDEHERMTLGLDEVRGADAQRIGWLLRSPVEDLRSASVETVQIAAGRSR